jgi:hypothetical protein
MDRHVAIVASASGDIADPFFTDPRDQLIASGAFASVTVIDAGVTTPSALELMTYDAVLVWSNLDFADAATLGDSLADYVDAGGGVVVAVFANSTATTGRSLTGRWLSHAYEVVVSGGGTTTGAASLGTIHHPAHPLISGVTTFAGGTGSFRPTTLSTDPSTTVVAEWDDGAILVAVRENTIGSRVDLGFYPPSDAVPGFEDFFWDGTTDGDVLLVNALTYAADRPALIPGDSDGDGDVDHLDADHFDLCFEATYPGFVPAGCLTFDFNQDDDVNCADWTGFLAAFTGGGDPPTSEACTVPTVSQWGLVVMAMVLLTAGTLVVTRRKRSSLLAAAG